MNKIILVLFFVLLISGCSEKRGEVKITFLTNGTFEVPERESNIFTDDKFSERIAEKCGGVPSCVLSGGSHDTLCVYNNTYCELKLSKEGWVKTGCYTVEVLETKHSQGYGGGGTQQGHVIIKTNISCEDKPKYCNELNCLPSLQGCNGEHICGCLYSNGTFTTCDANFQEYNYSKSSEKYIIDNKVGWGLNKTHDSCCEFTTNRTFNVSGNLSNVTVIITNGGDENNSNDLKYMYIGGSSGAPNSSEVNDLFANLKLTMNFRTPDVTVCAGGGCPLTARKILEVYDYETYNYSDLDEEVVFEQSMNKSDTWNKDIIHVHIGKLKYR